MLAIVHSSALRFERSSYELGEDLTRLREIAQGDAWEGAIFYAARVLEAIAREAAARSLGGTASSVFANLRGLGEAGLLPEKRRELFDTLRRLGNDVRHIRRAVGEHDAAVALAILDRVLRWVFVGFPLGPQMQVPEDERTWGPLPTQARRYSSVVLRLDRDVPDDATPQWEANDEFLSGSPAVAYMVGADLVMRNRHEEALGLAETVLTVHPNDLGLCRLRALALRRLDQPEEALRQLEALLKRYPQDQETLSLVAASLKRRWQSTGSQRDLDRAGKLYDRAWRASDRRNTYPGINAATVALLRGDRAGAQALAREVIALYEGRRSSVQSDGDRIRFSGYWDQVTLAEARLLTGEVETADHLYESAADAHRDYTDADARAQQQADLIRRALGSGDAGSAVTPPAPARTEAAGAPAPRPAGGAAYEPQPIDTSSQVLPKELHGLVEQLARNNHEHWAEQRLAQGWRWGETRDDDAKTHPCLVSYDELPESEKEIDRVAVRQTVLALLKLGYRVHR